MRVKAREQPARLLLTYRRVTIKALAAGIGRTPEYCGRVLADKYPATPAFRADVARFLGEPEEQLFLALGGPQKAAS